MAPLDSVLLPVRIAQRVVEALERSADSADRLVDETVDSLAACVTS